MSTETAKESKQAILKRWADEERAASALRLQAWTRYQPRNTRGIPHYRAR